MEDNIKGINHSFLAIEEQAGFDCSNEGLQAIQGVYSIKPDMLRNTREAADVPEEAKKQYIEAIGAELNKEGLE